MRHGIARALVADDAERRRPLKRAGFLTRDARAKERKKYGQPGARKPPRDGLRTGSRPAAPRTACLRS